MIVKIYYDEFRKIVAEILNADKADKYDFRGFFFVFFAFRVYSYFAFK
jgi:hypothetical protein